MKKGSVFIIIIAVTVSLAMLIYANNDTKVDKEPVNEKPVIYLYPEEVQDVSVKLDFADKLICTYPSYNKGWNVVAHPDGTLINKSDGLEYSYLFWEGKLSLDDIKMDEGFVVKGEDTEEFLRTSLIEMGLKPREYNEFIVYWLPRIQDNKYNLIHFAGDKYNDIAKLEIQPKPDTLIRVFMIYKELDDYMEIDKQKLIKYSREGFSVVEWGGARID